MFIIRKNAGIFSKLSLTIILLVFLILLITTLIASQISTRAIKNETYAANLLFLNKMNRLVENELATMDRIIVQFCNNSIDNRSIANDIKDVYERRLLYKKIQTQLVSNYDFINSVYIFYNQGSQVFSMEAVSGASWIIDTNTFFDRKAYNDFIASGRMPRILGMRQLKPDYYSQRTAEEPSWVISFIKGIPIFSTTSKDAIMVNIDEKHFLSLINTDYMPRDSILLISDLSGNIMFSCGQSDSGYVSLQHSDIEKIVSMQKGLNKVSSASSIKIDNKNYYITMLKSDSSDRVYNLIIPEQELFKPIYTVNRTIFIFSNLILIIGILISMLIDRRFFQPVLKILRMFKNKDEGMDISLKSMNIKAEGNVKNNEFKQIEGYIDNIINRSIIQEKQLQSYFAYYRERVLLSLLNGNKEAIRMLDEDILIFSAELKFFSVVLVNCVKKGREPDEVEYKTLMDAFIQELSNEFIDIATIEKISINRQKTALLFCMKVDSNFRKLYESAKKVLSEREEENVCYTVSIGNLYDGMQDINKSFSEAEKILQYHIEPSKSGVYDMNCDTSINEKSFVYPGDMESRIIKDMNTNNPQEMARDVKLFYNYMLVNNIHLTRVKKYSFILIYNIFKQLGKYNKDNSLLTDNIFEDVDSLNRVQEIEEWMLESLNRCLNVTNQENGINNRDLIEKVIKYMETHYMEEIGLNTIADYVYLSPSYMGKIFKEISGYTFTDYLIKVRMEVAAGLLINKNINISDIVGKVGYYSAQSFCRLFKSYYSCSPSEYRKKNAGSFLDDQM